VEQEMFKQKRNAFQRATDKKASIELLRQGWTYQEIAAEISRRNPYTITYQQIQKDLEGLRLEALAKAHLDMGILIAEELETIEDSLAKIKAAIEQDKTFGTVSVETEESERFGKKTTTKWVQRNLNVAYVSELRVLAARRSTLLGVDAYLKSLDINAAIEALTAKGYVVIDPTQNNESN
jgi:hypothetical protein